MRIGIVLPIVILLVLIPPLTFGLGGNEGEPGPLDAVLHPTAAWFGQLDWPQILILIAILTPLNLAIYFAISSMKSN